MSLDQIAPQYGTAEVTLVLADINQVRCVLVFGVVELCPDGQPSSPAITSGGFPQYRKAVGGGITLYSKRLFVDPMQALQFFRHPEQQPSGLRGLPIGLAGNHYVFPEGEEPLLLSPNAFDDSGLGAVLPRRATCLRVVSKFDTDGETLRLFNASQRAAMSAAVNQILGIDLTRFPEHVGAIHVCFSNPIVSRFDVRLSEDQRHLLLSVLERPGKSVTGALVELSNELAFGEGFSFLHELESRYTVVPLPANPSALRLRLYDSSRTCIESHPAASFIRAFAIETFSVTRTQLVRTLADGSTETTETETANSMNSGREGEGAGESPMEVLRAASFRRELDDLRKNKIFMFFPGTGSSKAEAMEALRDLLGRARQRVTVVDAYLAIDDVSMILSSVRYSSCIVRFLPANSRLSRRDDDYVSEETRMVRGLAELSPQVKFPVEIRKMPGDGAHDRWLQIDGQIYALGSSINHFGERATMLFKLPRPEEIADQIEQWWADAKPLSDSFRKPGWHALLWRELLRRFTAIRTNFRKGGRR